jgi:hypothetical protein
MRTLRGLLVRRAVVLPPLLFLAAVGYWKFLGTESFRLVIERLLEQALRAEVGIEHHEVRGTAEIVLHGVTVEFLSGGAASEARFTAAEARARARRVVGVGPLEEVVLTKAEVRVPSPAAARLDLFSRPAGSSAVRRIKVRDAAVSFSAGGRDYRVGGMRWTLSFPRGKAIVSGEVDRLGVEGLRSPGLRAESPRIAFTFEIEGSKVILRKLDASGRSGWRASGEDIVVDFGPEVPRMSGLAGGGPPVTDARTGTPTGEVDAVLDLWGLPVSRVYTPPEGVEVSPGANVRRTLLVRGPADHLRVEAATDVLGLSYADRGLGLAAGGVRLIGLRKVRHVDLLAILRGLVKEGEEKAASEGVP